MAFSQEVCEYFLFYKNLCISLPEAGGIFVSHKDHIMASRANNMISHYSIQSYTIRNSAHMAIYCNPY